MYRKFLLALSLLMVMAAQAQSECSEAKLIQSFAALEIARLLSSVGHCGKDWTQCETTTKAAIIAVKRSLDMRRNPTAEHKAMDHLCGTRTVELTEAVLHLATRKVEFLEQRLAALDTLRALPPELRPRVD